MTKPGIGSVGDDSHLTTCASAAGRAAAAADQGESYTAAAEALTPREQQALVRRGASTDCWSTTFEQQELCGGLRAPLETSDGDHWHRCLGANR